MNLIQDNAMSDLKSIKSEVVNGFSCAAFNQYSFDVLAYGLFGESVDDFCGVPRPSKWMKKVGVRNVLKFAGWLIRFSWRYFFAYLFFFKFFVNYFFKVGVFDFHAWASTDRVLSLAICSRSVVVINQALAGNDEKIWLTFPWGDASSQIACGNAKAIDCVSVLSRRQLVCALFYAFAVHSCLRKCKNQNLVMQSYAAFDWVVVYMAIKNLAPSTLITSEHHDRWAVLVDTYCSNMLNVASEVNFTLVQHGLEYEQTYIEMAKNSECDGLPYKLRCVTDAYLYSDEQFAIFRKNIFSKNIAGRASNVFYVRPKISVRDMGGGDVRVLFVGHTACEDVQVRIYNHISKIFDFSFFYKPHPTAKMHKDLYCLGWEVVEGRLDFPEVDFLISYQSTLVDEYKTIGVDAFVHQMILSEGEFDLMISGLVARLRDVSGIRRID